MSSKTIVPIIMSLLLLISAGLALPPLTSAPAAARGSDFLFIDVPNKEITITNAEETTWLLIGSVYYGGGHCSNVAADLLVDGSTVESWGQTGCYHNSDTLSAVSLQTIPAGTHTVRFNSAVGDASTYSHSLLMTTALLQSWQGGLI